MIDDEVRFLEVFHKTFGDNIRHDFSGARDGPATADAQRGSGRRTSQERELARFAPWLIARKIFNFSVKKIVANR
jgi:hypothetical protein